MVGYELLTGVSLGAQIGLGLVLALALGFFASPFWLWILASSLFLISCGCDPQVVLIFFGSLFVLGLPPIRQRILSTPVLKLLKALQFLPKISETERIALEAGATWVDGELFSGRPNFRKINQEPYRDLNPEEQAFLDGPVETVCQMVSDWEVMTSGDLSPEIWDYIKKHKFFGLIVPKAYGGLEFSAVAQSAIVQKISSRCPTLGITVMVPNSLGPAELINHYGTAAQKEYFLPRLAIGQEIPCFALTEPNAGSDAGSITSKGVVFKGENGQLQIRLDWDKRYITLAAVSTILGLAIKLEDPDNLLGKGKDLGITCVLVPSNTPGVELGKRHNPMGIPFYNCPTRGRGVVVSIDQIIGGVEGAGRGWQMLMECLAVGRSISLPAQAAALIKWTARLTSAYAFVRRQFGMSISRFEGVEEKLARIFGIAYMIEASRRFTCGAVDSGIKPAVVSAIAKYNSTELARIVINDGMDVIGGAGISRGPRNSLASAYLATPISITVEGANILTRTMIVFGQGALRCHPFAYAELKAAGENNHSAFDKALWGHIGFIVRNLCRAIVLWLSRGRLASVPGGYGRRYYQKLSWASASFAILADVAMGVLGGKLKVKEKLTGRFADILAWMYFATATLRRFEAEGQPKEHQVALDWSMAYAFSHIQESFEGIFSNFEIPVLGAVMRGPLRFLLRLNGFGRPPSDALGHRLVKDFVKPMAFRNQLTKGVYITKDPLDPHSYVEKAFELAYESEALLKTIRKATRSKVLPKGRPMNLIKQAVEKGVITQTQADTLRETEAAVAKAVAVDEFSLADYGTALLETSEVKRKIG